MNQPSEKPANTERTVMVIRPNGDRVEAKVVEETQERLRVAYSTEEGQMGQYIPKNAA